MKTATKSELLSSLDQFTGTEQYYRHWTGSLLYTDGVKYLADTAEAHWLIDLIASYRRKEPFQVWTLKRDQEGFGAVATMQEDSGQPVLVRQVIEYTDFPLPEITLWLVDGVLILKSEY